MRLYGKIGILFCMNHKNIVRRIRTVTKTLRTKTRHLLRWCWATLPRRIVSSFLIALFLVSPLYVLLTPEVQAAWWNETWSYRKAIAISNSSGSDLADFQVKVINNEDFTTEINAGKLQSDLDDLRFTAQNGELLNYWIEDTTAASVDVWVKVPNIPTSGATVYMYYGNANAASAQNGDGVFEFFDDFNDGAIDANKWTTGTIAATTGTQYSESGGNLAGGNTNRYIQSKNTFTGNYAAQTRVYTTTPADNGYSTIGFYASNPNAFGLLDHSGSSYFFNDGYFWYFGYSGSGQWNRDGVSVVGTSASYSRVGETSGSASNTATNSGISGEYLRLGSRYDEYAGDQNFSASWDWIFVRKAVSAEPSTTLSSAEQISPAPVGYWKFDEGTGTTANDASGKGNAGTLTNMASPATPTSGWQAEDKCVSGKCLAFDGTDDYVQFSPPGATLNSTFTQTAWIKTNSVSTDSGVRQYILTTQQNPPIKAVATYIERQGFLIAGNKIIAQYWKGNAASPGNLFSSDGSISANTWYFVAFTGDATGGKLYINGRIVASTSDVPVSTAVNQGFIGRRGDAEGSDSFNGSIDEPKIYPYARTADQIKQDYNAGIAGMSSAKGASVAMGDTSDKWMSDGLAGYWKMDETVGNATDYSGHNNTGVISGAPGVVAGKFGNGRNFASFADVATITSIPIPNSWSVASWFKYPFPTADCNTLTRGYAGDHQIIVDCGGYLLGTYDNVMGTGFHSSGFDTRTLSNGWHYISAVGDSGATKFYIDGSYVGTADYKSSSDITWIGNHSGGQPFGSIDETRIYNRALSANEVTKLYQYAPGPVAHWKLDESSGTSASDFSGNGNTGTLTGGPTWDNGKVGNALKFDGVDDRINVGTALSPSYITMETWVYRTSSTVDQGIIRKQGGYAWSLYNDTIQVAPGNNWTFYDTGQSIPLNIWTHLSWTYDGSKMILYKNGVNVWSASLNGVLPSNGEITYIGYDQNNWYWCGFIDDVRIYNYARTQSQILEDMNAGNPANNAPVAYYKFDEGAGTTANNAGTDGASINGTLTNMASPATATSGWTNDGKFGKALKFDGTLGNKVTTDLNYDFLPSFSLSAWIYPRTFPGGNDNEFKVIMGTQKGNNIAAGIVLSGPGGRELCYHDYATYLDEGFCSSGSAISLNQWQYVALSYQQGNMNMYVNGRLVRSANITKIDQGETMVIGGTRVYDYSGGRFFNGSIDEVKVFNYALTDDEIKAEYDRGSSVAMGEAKLLSVGGPATGAHARYCPPGNTEGNCASGLDPSPVGEWTLDEGVGVTAKDTSGNGNAGTLTNGPVWAPGKVGKGVKFDGVDDYVDTGTKFPEITSAVTVSTWVKPGTSQNLHADIWGNHQGNYRGMVLQQNAGNLNEYYFAYGNGVTWMPEGGLGMFTLAANVWTHVVVVKDATYCRIYLNGVENVSLRKSCSENIVPATEMNFSLALGASGMARWWKGQLDDVRIYNYARTPAQIAWDYNRGKPIAWYKMDECEGTTIHDASGNGNNGTWNGASGGTQTSVGTCQTSGTAWGNGVNGKWNSSLNFDGVDDYVGVDFRNLNLTKSQTLAAWIKTSGPLGGQDQHQTIVETDLSYLYGVKLMSYKNGSRVGLWLGTGSAGYEAFSNKNVNDGKWHFIAGVYNYDAGTVTMFVDGVADSPINSGQMLINVSTIGRIGRDYHGLGNNYAFNGSIDDVRIYNYALSSEQIKLLYNDDASLRFGASETASNNCGEYFVSGGGLTYGTVLAKDNKCWLDRNLGATRVATASNDTQSYGYYYQWGRGNDGHQLTTSTTTATLSSSDTPGHAQFIAVLSSPYDWRSPQNNNLWQGVNGVNNPCPTGFRLPTNTEQQTMITAEGITNSATAYASTLKLPVAGYRYVSDGSFYNQGSYGNYWSSSLSGSSALNVNFNSGSISPADAGNRANGFAVRCLKN